MIDVSESSPRRRPPPGAGPMRRAARLAPAIVACAAAALPATPARASFLAGDALDTLADVIAWVVLVVVPVVAIAVFWLVHVLPEKVAHRRHHPQKDAIQVLCLLSLVFGGLLWPLAWLWAYTRPTAYRLAYGTEKSDDWFVEQARRAQAGELDAAELASLREELDAIAVRGALSPRQRASRDALEDARAVTTGSLSAPAGTPAPGAREA